MHPNLSVRAALAERGAYMDVEELFEPLNMMYDSLMATGDESVANARLLDLLRQVGEPISGSKVFVMWYRCTTFSWPPPGACAYRARTVNFESFNF